MATSTSRAKLDPKKAVVSKPTQNDLRRLMKQKQQALKDTEKRKVDSPLAKYNDEGKLFCVLCNTQVKSELLWPAHLNGRDHKQNLAKLKNQKQAMADKANFKTPAAPGPLKRQADSSPHNPGILKKPKVSKTEEKSIPRDFFDDKPASKSTPSEESSEDDEEDMDTSESLTITTPSQVPSGFFESSKKKSNDDASKEAAKLNTREALPEGFFDDPIQDAKVRKVEYKDPVEEEWEKFQREIADATHKAQAIVDEEEEESTAERQIDEIEEQIHNWARVDALQRKKEELAKQQKNGNSKQMEDETSADEQEFEEFLDWRAKGSWR